MVSHFGRPAENMHAQLASASQRAVRTGAGSTARITSGPVQLLGAGPGHPVTPDLHRQAKTCPIPRKRKGENKTKNKTQERYQESLSDNSLLRGVQGANMQPHSNLSLAHSDWLK
jgi:hypothetical protein